MLLRYFIARLKEKINLGFSDIMVALVVFFAAGKRTKGTNRCKTVGDSADRASEGRFNHGPKGDDANCRNGSKGNHFC